MRSPSWTPRNGLKSRMKYLDEYREPRLAARLLEEIRRTVTRSWTLMEICGGQTHSIVKYGIDQLLPSELQLVHGPGCPVCVTPLEMIDRAHAIARTPGVIFCSFGDMLRVPGSSGDLFQIKAEGGDVRVVYSPLDCLKLARAHSDRRVVFYAIGFETTAPANAMSVWLARAQGLHNFSLLVSHVLVPPAITAILESPSNRVQAFLGPGHVCAVMGWKKYEALVERYHAPVVVTGFEPIDLLEGILLAVRQLEQGRATVENQYARAVTSEGNPQARKMINQVFEVCDRAWRGIGIISKSGYRLREEFRDFDAEHVFAVESVRADEPAVCISGLVLQGQKKPHQCPAFGNQCTPQTPLGATMVSSEGACAAYYNYGRHLLQTRGAD
jgi:hydrogenase expression/formation protein HypD